MRKILLILMILLCCQNVNAQEQNTIPVLTIAKEASGESFDAQVLVGTIIRVRAQERKKSFEKICLQPKQFSCWNPGIIQKLRTLQEIKTAEQAWEHSKYCTLKINLYHDISVLPYWVKSKKVKFICQSGKLKFYYEERG